MVILTVIPARPTPPHSPHCPPSPLKVFAPGGAGSYGMEGAAADALNSGDIDFDRANKVRAGGPSFGRRGSTWRGLVKWALESPFSRSFFPHPPTLPPPSPRPPPQVAEGTMKAGRGGPFRSAC